MSSSFAPYCLCGHPDCMHDGFGCTYWEVDHHPYNRDKYCKCGKFKQDNLRYLEDKYKGKSDVRKV